jgi:peptidoglycan/LPS O-acetylase OafA/YrhL
MTDIRSASEYRPDIDGIRAIAVAAVMLFHLDVAFMQGGFAGVDVFFVISGYLITGIILRALEKGAFTISGFYVRRINRILPALLLVLASVWVTGWVVMFAREFTALGRDVLGGSTFIANVLYYQGLGYWDSTDRPLLHLWSLAVEEQFYVFWPLALLVVWKANRNVRWTIIAIVEISFVANIYEVRHSGAQAAFFLPLARFWEILSGALLLQLETSSDATGSRLRSLAPRVRDAMSVTGAALVLAAFATAREGDLWPGVKGLIPVAGTLLLIAAGHNALVNRTLLSRRPVVAIGLISYPLYLWHWPLIVFGWMIFEKNVPLLYSVAVVPISIALAWATFQFVEKPIRFGKNKKRSAVMLLPALGATALIGLVAWKGMIGTRLEDSVAHLDAKWGRSVQHAQQPPLIMASGFPAVYVLPGNGRDTAVFYGDSHMVQYWPRVEELAEKSRSNLPTAVLMGYPGCSVFPGVNNPGNDLNNKPWVCDRFNRAFFEYAARPSVKTVVISSYWEAFMGSHVRTLPRSGIRFGDVWSENVLTSFETQIGELVKSGKTVYIILANPIAQTSITERAPRRLSGFNSGSPRAYSTRQFQSGVTQVTSARLRQIAARAGAKIIDPVPFLCSSDTCPALTSWGEPIYRDDNHLRAGFVRRHAIWIDPILTR